MAALVLLIPAIATGQVMLNVSICTPTVSINELPVSHRPGRALPALTRTQPTVKLFPEWLRAAARAAQSAQWRNVHGSPVRSIARGGIAGVVAVATTAGLCT